MSAPVSPVKRRPQDTAIEINARNAKERRAQPRKLKRSQRRLFLQAICDALEKGPATAREINLRMGLVYSTNTTALLPVLERMGRVARLGIGLAHEGARGRATKPILWALVIKEPS